MSGPTPPVEPISRRRRFNPMSRFFPLAVVGAFLGVAGLLAGFFYVPSPFDEAAAGERALLESRLDERMSQLEADLVQAQLALQEEAAARAALDTEMAQALEELAAAHLTQYEEIVAAFAHAATVACGDRATADFSSDPAALAGRAAGCGAEGILEVADALAAQPVVCGVMPAGTEVREDLDRCVMLYAHSSEVRADALAVTPTAGDGFAAVLSTAITVEAGDTLDVSGYFRVTNELPATVGVGAHLWAFDLDGDRSEQWRIGPSNGDNVDRDRHHMPIALQTVYTVPADWPEGHRMAIVLKADAHSTATDGLVDVDDNGNLIVRITRA